MAEITIIAKTDINGFFPIGKNLNDERVDPHILRAQQAELKPFLGDEMYYDFIENIGTPENQRLFDGGEYVEQGGTIYFSGVKALLSAWSYSRIIKNNQVFVTRGGVTSKDTEQSEQHLNSMVQQRSRDAASAAIRIQHEIALFIDKNRDDYPLWQRSTSTNAPTRTAFKMTRV